MKLAETHVIKRLMASLFIYLVLLAGPLVTFADVVASPENEPDLAPARQGSGPLVIEGEVERIISQMQPRGLINSRAIVTVDKVVQGTLPDNQVTIRYVGGTVGELTLRVSNEPYLVEGMRLRAKLVPDEVSDYRIANPDTDLIILEGEIGAAWVPIGPIWPAGSIPVPIRINANTGDVPGDGERTAVQSAMNTWVNAPCSHFQYQYQTGACATDTYDSVNCVSWSPAVGGSTLGVTHMWAIGSNIVETDVTFFDGDHNWSTSPGSDEYDVESVALHELGHVLGLHHDNSNPAYVMYWTISSGVTKRSLHTDDRDGACVLYPGPPLAPSGLTATVISQTQINLSWNDNSSDEDGFEIERSIDSGATWPYSATVGANVTTHPDPGLLCQETYHYRVRAYNARGASDYSNIVYAIPGGDAYELDDTFSEAKSIVVNAKQTHNFHTPGDEDWVKLEIIANKPYTITTSSLGSSTDTALELYDTDGVTMLTSNDNCPGGGVESCINGWSDPDSGDYFIKIRQIGGMGACTNYEYDLAVVSDVTNIFLPLILKNNFGG